MTELGKKLFDLNAVPTKDVLKNKAKVCPPLSAFCEIFDNIFDNYEENGFKGTLEIKVDISSLKSTIVITENSGGVRNRKLEPLVRLGVPYHGVRGSIGTWGEGLKVALFSLANEVEIRSHFAGEQPVSLQFGKGWLENKEWSVPVYELKKDALPAGCTQFVMADLVRPIEWSDVMRELGVIYGHKVLELQANGRHPTVTFSVNGQSHTLKFRALASESTLHERMSWPPHFQPRSFTAKWTTENGSVAASLVVGLTPRHSAETSGVYLYGNGRLFARALRTRAVGYGEGGNSILRDHPTCWRIHVFVFLTADDGADIPWQAPLKDGVSENHPITARVREFIRTTVAPYAKFAKVAKEADLMPYTAAWEKMTDEERAKILFDDGEDGAVKRLKALPKEVLDFAPSAKVESTPVETRVFERLSHELDSRAKHARAIIAKRGQEGAHLQEIVMKSLNPEAFSGTGGTDQAVTPSLRVARTTRITLELREVHLTRLRGVFKVESDKDAVMEAIAFALQKLDKKGIRRA